VLKVKAENRGAGRKPEKLIRLDEWYQNTLPKLIQKRGKDAHLLHEELVQLMEWKQTRGKSYPQLTHLIKINTPRAVMMETKKAFRKLPNLEQALNALSNLKGVGTTMASALLAAACPETAPFMADECLMAIPEFESIDYTVKEYLKFNNGTEENGAPQEPPKPKKWTAHKVEMALWAHYVASDLQPDLLKGMPESNGVASTGSAVTVSVANGSAAVPELDNEDDSSQNGVPPSDESNLDSESASKDASVLTNGTALMNTDSMDGSENGNPAPAEAEATETTATSLPADSLDDCTKSGDSLDEAPAVEATAAAVATLCTADGEDSQSSNSQKRPLYCDENSEEQPELSAPKLIKL
ncbi:AAEL007075-PA, partial [Aedes aegypti]